MIAGVGMGVGVNLGIGASSDSRPKEFRLEEPRVVESGALPGLLSFAVVSLFYTMASLGAENLFGLLGVTELCMKLLQYMAILK